MQDVKITLDGGVKMTDQLARRENAVHAVSSLRRLYYWEYIVTQVVSLGWLAKYYYITTYLFTLKAHRKPILFQILSKSHRCKIMQK